MVHNFLSSNNHFDPLKLYFLDPHPSSGFVIAEYFRVGFDLRLGAFNFKPYTVEMRLFIMHLFQSFNVIIIAKIIIGLDFPSRFVVSCENVQHNHFCRRAEIWIF